MKRLNTILVLLALAAMSLFALGGCSDDDGVTPDEEIQITASDAAGQAASIAWSMLDVLEELNSKAEIMPVNEDCIYGSYHKDSDPDHVYTDATNFLTLDFDCDGIQDNVDNGKVTFDITSVAGVANGTGRLEVGGGAADFTVTDVTLGVDNKPNAGQLIASTSGFTATITFTGGDHATVVVGTRSWDVDFSDNGSITEL